MKPCPVPQCQGDRKDSQLACAFHWARLPAALRHRLMDGYRTHKGSPLHLANVGEAMALLRGLA